MSTVRAKRSVDAWGDAKVGPGEARDVMLTVTEAYSGVRVKIPLHVRRSKTDGPVVFVTAALHGDELNGAGAVRALIRDPSLELKSGALILVPVLNMLAFERHSRYLPDRRDLNRSFPGKSTGSLASRMARVIFDEIVGRADYGIDLHTAAIRRTNFPNVRADMNDKHVRFLAQSFGSAFIINGEGPKGAFRRTACGAGCPTIILEGGEIWKVEPTIVECAALGIRNVLMNLGMIEGERARPPLQMVIENTTWLRSEGGGFLQFHVAPGEIVLRGEALATNTSLLGRERSVITAPFDGVVIGMTTLPAVSPGEPVCHLGELPKGGDTASVRAALRDDPFYSRVVDDLASNLLIVERDDHRRRKPSAKPGLESK